MADQAADKVLERLRGHVSGLEEAQHYVQSEAGRLYAMGGDADVAAATCRVIDGTLRAMIHQASKLVFLHIEANK